jgi:hypothetical protein
MRIQVEAAANGLSMAIQVIFNHVPDLPKYFASHSSFLESTWVWKHVMM